jgi:2-methylcitrate dehydratase PrpD
VDAGAVTEVDAMSGDVTVAASQFVSGAALGDVPETVRRAARHSILDGFGLALAGSRAPAAEIARAEVDSYGMADGRASVLGTTQRLPGRFAAFLNGLAIHADDYDDTQLALRPDRVYGLLTHPTAPVLPAALALGEGRGADGASLLLAYLVGVEVETKVAEAIAPRHYEAGFHSTGTAGTIGAAAAAARMLRLDPHATAVALGIAASAASGLRENFGTMTKPLHAGRAAENGVLAAQLASRGFTAAVDVLEARRGFFFAAGGGYDPEIAMAFGHPWTFADPGVSIKPYPSGSLTHPAMTVLAGLIAEHGFGSEDVVEVRVGTNRHMPTALIHHDPKDHLAAKFSMEFCMAILCVEGRGGLAQFTDQMVNRPDVRAMMGRVRFEVDEEADAAGFHTMTSLVRVSLRDGRVLSGRAAFARGSPQDPMTQAELIDKFLECAEVAGIERGAAARAAELILDLEAQPGLEQIVELLTPSAPSVRRITA